MEILRIEQEKELEVLRAKLQQCKLQVNDQKKESEKYSSNCIELNKKIDKIEGENSKHSELLIIKQKLLTAKNFD